MERSGSSVYIFLVASTGIALCSCFFFDLLSEYLFSTILPANFLFDTDTPPSRKIELETLLRA